MEVGALVPKEKGAALEGAAVLDDAAGVLAATEAPSGGLLAPKENPPIPPVAVVLAPPVVEVVFKEGPAGLRAAAGALLVGAAFVDGAAPKEKPPVVGAAAGGADGLLLLAAPPPKPENGEAAGAVPSAGLAALGWPNRDPPPPAGAAGFPKPANMLEGGAEAGVVLDKAGPLAPPVVAGVPNEKAGLDAGVVEPVGALPKRFPLPPGAPKEKELPPAGLAPLPPSVCPPVEPNRPPLGAGEEVFAGCCALLGCAAPKLKGCAPGLAPPAAPPPKENELPPPPKAARTATPVSAHALCPPPATLHSHIVEAAVAVDVDSEERPASRG